MSAEHKQNVKPRNPGASANQYPPATRVALFTATPALAAWAYHALVEGSDLVAGTLICLALVSVATTMVSRRVKSISASQPVAPERKSSVATKDSFLALGERMIRQSRRHEQPLSVLVLELHDLPELKELFGADIAKQLVTKLVNSLHAVAPARSVVVRSEDDVFTVFLPGLREEAAREAVKRTFGGTISVEIDAQEQEIVLLPDFRIHSLGDDVTPFQGWYEETLRNFRFARTVEERRQRHLRLEHESHCTKPAPLIEARPLPTAYVRHAETIPVPLGVR